MQTFKKLSAATVGFLLPALAFAQVDLSAVTDAIEGHQANLVAIGAAVLALVYLVRVFAWGRKI